MEVLIEHDGDEKYIICTVTNIKGAYWLRSLVHPDPEGQNRLCLVSLPYLYHSDIAEAYKKYLDKGDRITRVHGGGILTIDREQRKIKTYGRSGGYGKPKLEHVQSLLEKFYGDWDLDITITDEIRG